MSVLVLFGPARAGISVYYTSNRNTQGLFPIVGTFFFQSPMLAVRMYAVGRVRSAAMHSLVEGLHTERISARRESFRYGVSIIICV